VPHLIALHPQRAAVGRIGAARCGGVIGPPAQAIFDPAAAN
jgi:hypothetical protein